MKSNLMNAMGFSLMELMLVLLIFTFLFGAMLTIMTTQDRSWRIGYDKVTAQQEARKAVDEIARLLRQSNPNWVVSGVNYPVAITANNRIDFWQPIFDAAGVIITLRKVTFKLNPNNIRQLLKKEGVLPEVAVANDVDSVNFGGGCAGCAAFNCADVAMDCPVVTIEIRTRRIRQVPWTSQMDQFSLLSQVTLRNTNIAASAGVVIEEPEAGEF